MLTTRRANGASKIRSEPAFVAAAPKVSSILVVQHTLPVGKLVQVEVAAEVQLEEGGRGVGERDVPRLGANAGEGLRRQLHIVDDLIPIRNGGSGNRVSGIRV